MKNLIAATALFLLSACSSMAPANGCLSTRDCPAGQCCAYARCSASNCQ